MKGFNKNYIFIALGIFIILGYVWYCFGKNDIDIDEKVDDDILIENNKERLPFSQFKGDFFFEKEGIFLEYPKVDILSDIGGTISNINVKNGEEVKKGKILVQMENYGREYEYNMRDAENDIENLQTQYQLMQESYNQLNLENQDAIKLLEDKISMKEREIIKYMETGDEDSQIVVEQEIEGYENKISNLQVEYSYKEQEYKSEIIKIENEIQSLRNVYDQNYNNLNKLNARATIDGIVGDFYVNKGDKVEVGTPLLNIINMENLPEILLELSFDEYLLIKNLLEINVLFEKRDNEGNIENYIIRGSISNIGSELDENGNIPLTVKIEKEDGIEYDFVGKDVKIIVSFFVKYDGASIFEKCFKKINQNSGIITLRRGENIFDQNVDFKHKIQDMLLIDNFVIDSLENDEKINELNMCYDYEILCEME